MIGSARYVSSKYLEATQTAQYTSANAKTVIDKCVITNVSSSNVKLNVNIVNSGSSVADSNIIISDRIVEPNETYNCPEIVGLILESGDFISTLSSVASALVINLNGRTIT